MQVMVFYSSSLKIVLGKISSINSNEKDHKTNPLSSPSPISFSQFLTINYDVLTMCA